ncbi:hypothetical protein JAAARDRAFT_53595 [Jaapia argillacea MUCL 33604]|uniref:LYR motif-containing protein Cup1-like N-terminal domain-containing protein n=1 Tax=Jaapia argillacea MUCL 33604 TaxID=933084 RepID=A0A067QIM7_9AGAM|nr:hypothetical protein JAAARDRAFT_53595 [Jaapia argillacea MUCL 33604]
MKLTANNTRQAAFSLYRAYLRQIRILPHNYLRQFFFVKSREDVEAVLLTKAGGDLSLRKLKRAQQTLRKLEAANVGDKKAFEKVLELAYGRKGKLKWELMQPLLSDPNAPLPPRIIPQVERSRPPVYSPELTALLTSQPSRTTKPLIPKQLANPPELPARADPNSREAQLLGPFSKRREVNIRWRFFTTQSKRVLPPLQVNVGDETLYGTGSKEAVARIGIRGFGLQGSDALEDVLKIAGTPYRSPVLPRRQRRLLGDHVKASSPSDPSSFDAGKLPARWLRRRYQELLSRIPILTYSPPFSTGTVNTSGNPRKGKYEVSLARSVVVTEAWGSAARLPDADDADLVWLEASNRLDKGREAAEDAMAKARRRLKEERMAQEQAEYQ